MQKNRLRTYPIKSLTIFLTIAFLVSVAMVVGFIFLSDELMVIRVLVWIFCGLFAVAALVVLIYQLFFYIAVDEENFYRYSFMSKYTVPLKKIDYIKNTDGFYQVHAYGRKFATFASNTKESQEIIIFLENHNVKVDW